MPRGRELHRERGAARRLPDAALAADHVILAVLARGHQLEPGAVGGLRAGRDRGATRERRGDHGGIAGRSSARRAGRTGRGASARESGVATARAADIGVIARNASERRAASGGSNDRGARGWIILAHVSRSLARRPTDSVELRVGKALRRGGALHAGNPFFYSSLLEGSTIGQAGEKVRRRIPRVRIDLTDSVSKEPEAARSIRPSAAEGLGEAVRPFRTFAAR